MDPDLQHRSQGYTTYLGMVSYCTHPMGLSYAPGEGERRKW
jgi:hypothetical protein